MPEPTRIDVRGPRFAAAITSVLLLVALALCLNDLNQPKVGWFAYQPLSGQMYFPTPAPPLSLVEPGFIAMSIIAALFLWGVVSPGTAPWSVLFRKVVQPRLRPATAFEDPRPPRFAQGVGLFVTVLGLVLDLASVPLALPIAAGAAFMAAFLNAVFGLCLGCQLYLLLLRAGIVGRRTGV